jgi:hypothetical protein
LSSEKCFINCVRFFLRRTGTLSVFRIAALGKYTRLETRRSQGMQDQVRVAETPRIRRSGISLHAWSHSVDRFCLDDAPLGHWSAPERGANAGALMDSSQQNHSLNHNGWFVASRRTRLKTLCPCFAKQSEPTVFGSCNSCYLHGQGFIAANNLKRAVVTLQEHFDPFAM